MAAKKAKSGKKVLSRARAVTKASARKTAKKVAKNVAKQAKGLLGKLAQRSAQLIIDSGVLGEAPKQGSKRAPAKKRPRKA